MTNVKLENRRYIGSKSKLLDWIEGIIINEAKGAKSFFDVFAGTGVVSKRMYKYYDHIILNDFLFSNYVVYKAFFENVFDDINIVKFIDKYNSLDSNSLKENYFSINFGGKYFSKDNSKIIGFIRDDLEKNKNILGQSYYVLLASLMYAMDKVANTVGHYDAFIKKSVVDKKIFLKIPEKLDIKSNVDIFSEDSNELVKKVSADIAYIDPPYNSRQYARFYHIWENVAENKKPELFGTALKPDTNKISKYCQNSAREAFEDLISNLDVKYIFVSYNNTYSSKSSSSKNKICLDDIKNILEKKGKTKIYTKEHAFFNAGKTDFFDHKEIIFVTKVGL